MYDKSAICSREALCGRGINITQYDSSHLSNVDIDLSYVLNVLAVRSRHPCVFIAASTSFAISSRPSEPSLLAQPHSTQSFCPGSRRHHACPNTLPWAEEFTMTACWGNCMLKSTVLYIHFNLNGRAMNDSIRSGQSYVA
jgi:hypothetical protein